MMLSYRLMDERVIKIFIKTKKHSQREKNTFRADLEFLTQILRQKKD